MKIISKLTENYKEKILILIKIYIKNCFKLIKKVNKKIIKLI